MSTDLKIGAAEFLVLRNRIGLIAALVRETDGDALDAFIRQCETADVMGPYLDPTLWMRGHADLVLLRDHARAFAAFHKAVGG